MFATKEEVIRNISEKIKIYQELSSKAHDLEKEYIKATSELDKVLIFNKIAEFRGKAESAWIDYLAARIPLDDFKKDGE